MIHELGLWDAKLRRRMAIDSLPRMRPAGVGVAFYAKVWPPQGVLFRVVDPNGVTVSEQRTPADGQGLAQTEPINLELGTAYALAVEEEEGSATPKRVALPAIGVRGS